MASAPNYDSVQLFVQEQFPQVEEFDILGDDRMDFGDIGGIYNDASGVTKSANNTTLTNWLSTRANLPALLTFNGPVTPGFGRREPGVAYFSSAIDITVGGIGNPSDLWITGASTIRNDDVTGSTAAVKITRTSGTTPVIIYEPKIVSSGSGIEFVTPGATTRYINGQVEISGTGTLTHDDFTDWSTAPFALKVDNADGLYVENFNTAVCSGHGVMANRWNKGGFQGNVRNAVGIGLKCQQMTGVDVNGRAESNKGYGVYFGDSGVNRYESSAFQAQDGASSAMAVWCENNGQRDSIYGPNNQNPPQSGGYWAVESKFQNCARLIIGEHFGWADNMTDIDEGSRNSVKFIEHLHIEQSRAPALQLINNNTVDASVVLPQDNWGNASVTTIDQVWSNATYRTTAAKFGTPGTDERIRMTWPAFSLENVTNPITGYWRPWGNSPVSISGGEMLIWEIEYRDVTGALATWCNGRRNATQMQSPRFGACSIQPMGGGRRYMPIWNTQSRKTGGRLGVADSRSDISVGIDAFFPGMEFQANGFGQPDEIVIELAKLNLYVIADN